jgi:hypothetical protein
MPAMLIADLIRLKSDPVKGVVRNISKIPLIIPVPSHVRDNIIQANIFLLTTNTTVKGSIIIRVFKKNTKGLSVRYPIRLLKLFLLISSMRKFNKMEIARILPSHLA